MSLLLTSKQLRNKINARLYIGRHIKKTLGIPRPTLTIKVLTFFKMRGTGNLPSGVLTDYSLAMKDACLLCLKHGYLTRWAYRNGKDCELFSNGVDECMKCKEVVSWKRTTCAHLAHFKADKTRNGQAVCAACF